MQRRVAPQLLVLRGALVLVAVLVLPSAARADIAGVDYEATDQRGSLVHAVPLRNHQVRMVAERVVLVPFWDEARRQPRLLTHVWYDLVNDGPRVRLQLGFPEMRSLVDIDKSSTKRPWSRWELRKRSWKLPTITSFAARRGRKFFRINRYPGVAWYRRWFTFGVVLEPRRRVRLHTTYLSSLALVRKGQWTDGDSKVGVSTRYFLHYILHTGALWRGTIGRGEILLYDRGDLRLLRRFTRLKPTLKDDINIELDLKSIHWSKNWWPKGLKGMRHVRWTDWLRLPSASGHLASGRVDTHVGLIVDGDPKTQWVSPRGKALRSFVQLPSSPRRRLTTMEVVSGTPCTGCVRPSRLVAHCVTRRGTWVLTKNITLPNTAGPHRLALPKRTSCDAIRLQIAGVHGDPRAPVAIAEVVQRFAKPRPKKLKRAKIPTPYRTISKAGGPRHDPLAFDVVNVDHVMWSSDGAVLHYRLQLENVGASVGLRLGYFLDVATGKVLSTYRLDRAGKLPLPYARDWARALPYEQGIARLRKHGFRPAIASRLAPPVAKGARQSLRLRGRVKGRTASVDIQATDHGFRWTFKTPPRPAARTASATLELLHHRSPNRERLLARRTRRLDLRFAARHGVVWRARRPFFKTLIKMFRSQWAYDSQHIIDLLPGHIWKRMPQVWHLLTYPYREAYGGEARVFWEPRGRAVATIWIHRKDHSGNRPIESRTVFKKDTDGTLLTMANYDKFISHCARDLTVMVCPWDRRGDPRHRVGVTVHNLATHRRGTHRRATGASGARGAGAKGAGARPAGPKPPAGKIPDAIRAPKSGCGCRASTGGTHAPPVVLFVLLLSLLRRSVRCRLGATVVVIALGAFALAGSRADARSAGARKTSAPPLRLRTMFNLPLPAGGRITGPKTMRHLLVIAHYLRPRKAVLAKLRKVLRRDKWVITKLRSKKAGWNHAFDPDYLQLWVRKGNRRVRMVLVRQRRRGSPRTVVFVTPDTTRAPKK